MDFNQLYFAHQLLLLKAGRARTGVRRDALEVAASHVAGRIGCMQGALGASAARQWTGLAGAGDDTLTSPGRLPMACAS